MHSFTPAEQAAINHPQHDAMLRQILAWSAINSGSRNLDGLAAMARELTSSYIVVGRTITGSADPYATYKKVYQDFKARSEEIGKMLNHMIENPEKYA